MIVNPRNAVAKDLSINNPLSQEVEVHVIVSEDDFCKLCQKKNQENPLLTFLAITRASVVIFY